MRHGWQVQAGYQLQTAPGFRRPEPERVPGIVWELRDADTVTVGIRVRARSADAALAVAERRVADAWGPLVRPVRLGAAVRRAGRGGLRRRSAVVLPGAGGTEGPGDGPAGVREPRRPLPAAPTASEALPLPRDPAAG